MKSLKWDYIAIRKLDPWKKFNNYFIDENIRFPEIRNLL